MGRSFQITEGNIEPLGLSIQGDTANFALFSNHATQVSIGFFWDGEEKVVPMKREGDIWRVAIKGVPKGASYAFRCEGPEEHFYNPKVWLADPYAKMPVDFIKTRVALPEAFDWRGVEPPKIPSQDLIIYEMHVRGFTNHPSSDVSYPGTYLGTVEKIPYLKKLGVNAVELLPIFEFDETHLKKKPLVNYWGYNPTHFFAPKKWYAHADPIEEFKTLVRELHSNGILIILDVVYNHTGEGKEKDYYVNFRGIDNSVYYLIDEEGNNRDLSGCGNTLNTNHPIVQRLILDSLHYWIEEMHVDGFRFDLASILTLDPQGKPIEHSPVIEAISKDPLISKALLIAEPWDAAGLYQLGSFPKWGRWAEWNGRYRDVVRRFIKGTDGKAGVFANVLCGSEMIYHSSKTPLSSVNFITCHDGFCLRDLVAYQNKHNYDNGEGNRDGSNHNDSWNCGCEGPTSDPNIQALRERQMRNFLLALFLSQGIPMLPMGDEYGHTRRGNNNPYVQDNEINWFLWDQQNPKIVQFVSSLTAFRKRYPQLRHVQFLTDAEVDWYTNWDYNSRLVAFCLKNSPNLYIAFNAHPHSITLTLPSGYWRLVVNSDEDWLFHQNGPLISSIELSPYSSLLAVLETTLSTQ